MFAGQDLEATAQARAYFSDVPPSSPSFALFKGGELVHFVPRPGYETQAFLDEIIYENKWGMACRLD